MQVKTIDENSGGAGNDVLATVLKVSAGIEAAEAKVSGIRIELEAANAELRCAIQARRSVDEGRRHSGHDSDIRAAEAKVAEIEGRLRAAVEWMTSEREAFAPKYGRIVAPLRASAGEEILAAAAAVARAREILVSIETHARRHGLSVGQVARLLPRDLEQIGTRLKGAAK